MAINYKTDTKKGKYRPMNPEKYIGTKIPIYKSKWEQKVFYALDKNPNVLQWGYETIEIYYPHPIHGNFTVYYPDVFCKIIASNGKQEKLLVEIKPFSMTMMPKEPKIPKNKTTKSWTNYQKRLRAYQNKVRDFAVNKAKWIAAQKWCTRHNVRWILCHEENTGKLFNEGSV